MKVSVIINTYSLDRYDDFCDAVEAVLDQTYEPIELILVVDGNEPLYQKVETNFGDIENVIAHCTEENVGNSASRTAGAKQATGDILVVTDDDGVAEPDWIEEIVRVYKETDAIAVGGKVVPIWIEDRPDFFPDEFLWLVGCTEKGFADHMEEVRNTYGPNLSFRKDIFDNLGGFSSHVGRQGEKQIQAHETEICSRMRREYGRGVIYTEEAVINHKIYPYRTKFGWLVRRCFRQGHSKRILEKIVPNSTDEENEYLRKLLLEYVPKRIKNIVRDPTLSKMKQLITIFFFTFLVGVGYLYGLLDARGFEPESEHTHE